jgi:hypothetical protein
MTPARRERWRAVLVSSAVLAAVAFPGLRLLVDRESGDGFPLSTFPMFTEDHGRVLELPTVVEVTATGVERLSPAEIAGTDQVVQAWETVRRAVERGRDAAHDLCDEVAGRVDGPTTLAVVVERYDIVAWAAHPHGEPQNRRTVARCRSHP